MLCRRVTPQKPFPVTGFRARLLWSVGPVQDVWPACGLLVLGFLSMSHRVTFLSKRLASFDCNSGGVIQPIDYTAANT